MQKSKFLSLGENIISIYHRWISSVWAVPFILFGVSFVTFGLLAPKLGFYMDDWHFVHYAYTRGIDSLKDVLFYDSRPFAGWAYLLGFRLLGYKPIVWHITTLVLRAATAIVFWLLFRSLWKNKKEQGFYISLIFLIHPFFLLQPMTVAYSIHWLGFFLYALSLWLMLISLSQKNKYVFVIIGIALIAEILHLITSEYFSGLEILRPFILWVIISREKGKFLYKIRKTFYYWFPYLLVLSSYAYWRIFLFIGPPKGDRNSPILLYRFIEEPLGAAFSLLVTALKDSTIILFGSWYPALEPAVFNLSSLFASFVLLAMIVMFFILYFLLNRLFLNKKSTDVSDEKKWRKEAGLLGISALFLGTLPFWIIGKSIATHTNQMAATRFGIPSMLGAAILLSVMIEFFITDRKKANIVIALLVTLGAGVHLHNAHQYERSWEKQKNLYYQLVERIPALEPNTAIISAGEILFFMGEYPTSYAINTIYYADRTMEGKTPYWFSSIYASYYKKIDAFLEGMPLEEEHLLSSFSGNSKESLIISFEPELEQCLWVLRPEDSDLRLISELERNASLNSAIDRIQIDSNAPRHLPPDIFGEEIPENWCSYYQKADLARQRGEWAKITSLWEDAQQSDKSPANGFEYIPFIEAYAHQENWKNVKKMTRQANKVSQGMASILCSTLYNIRETTPSSVERDNSLSNLTDYLQCQG